MTTKWIFKKKVDKEGNVISKARCVSRGFMHIPGVDSTKSFAPVASDTGFRVVIGIFLYYLHMSPKYEWVLKSFDVEAAFLNALLTHPVCIEWSKGIKEFGLLSEEECKTTCAELLRAMYGNIDTSLQWMRTFANILIGDDMKLKKVQLIHVYSTNIETEN
jgi:Reverse transcriptase (RNA-dependent DNA polymerase)